MADTDAVAETITMDDSPDFRSELSSLLNKFSRENGSDTPDFILRDFICDSLAAFDRAVNARSKWYVGL